jgi:pantoate--beta-alanine ligase
MQVIESVAALREAMKASPARGFVPTMGNLHEGHIDLTRIARREVGQSGLVIMSIFVNRLQFGPHEDFDRYPRTFAEDCEKCRAAGVDIVFAPPESELYPVPQGYVVEPPAIQHELDGAVRPGHFKGVATVVLKLFNVVQPSVAVFGKKDYQQCRVLDGMVAELNLPIRMVFGETVRAADGLALSSRNGYLSEPERAEAPALHRELLAVAASLRANADADHRTLEREAESRLRQRGWDPDYVAIRRQRDLAVAQATDRSLVVLAAARLGSTRLIDNLEVAL